MGMMQRRKGKNGEREVAALLRDVTGHQVQRRVRQHDGDSDLVGIPGWCVEVKRHARGTTSTLQRWWVQTMAQARLGERPVMFFRFNGGQWRAVWAPLRGSTYADTAEADPKLWWSMVSTQRSAPVLKLMACPVSKVLPEGGTPCGA
jgi:hypothetical protein